MSDAAIQALCFTAGYVACAISHLREWRQREAVIKELTAMCQSLVDGIREAKR